MAAQAIGDLAQGFLLRRQTAEAKRALEDHARALTTGRVSDPGTRLEGDFSALAAIEHRLATAAGDRRAAAEAATLARAQQAALATVAGAAGDLAVGFLDQADAAGAGNALRGAEAEAAFASVVASLNTLAAGRSLFAGAASDGPALAPAETMLADIRAAVAGLDDPADVTAAVEAWFADPGGGFATTGYLGSDTPMSPVPLGGSDAARLESRASDPALRDVLSALALGAIAGDPGSDLSGAARAELFRAAGDRLLAAQDGVTELRATIGQAEAQIETAKARLAAERTAAELARSELVGADRYEAATRLKDAERQLELVYEVTARLSRLSLLDRLA